MEIRRNNKEIILIEAEKNNPLASWQFNTEIDNSWTDEEIKEAYASWRVDRADAESKACVNLEVSRCKEDFPEIYIFIEDMYLGFVADESNGAKEEEFETWKKEGYIQFQFVENGINYTAWTTEHERDNQDTWTSDKWSCIIENGEIEKYLDLIKL